MLSNGINRSTVESIVLWIVGFARYGWNKAHAVSYAMLSYRTAWLRCNQPLEFWCAMLNSELDDSKRFPILMNEAHNIDDVKIAPPHINLSEQYFILHNKELYAGLLSIKGIGEKVCGAITSERANRGPFKDVDDLRNRIPPKSVNCRTLELLVNSGAFREVKQLTEMEKWQKEMGG
jgi:DNA polymerase-3 subunit alpha